MSAEISHSEKSREPLRSSEREESIDNLKARADALRIAGYESMSREELLYAIHKAQGGDGGLSI